MKEFKGTPGPWKVVGTCCDGVGADFDSGEHKPVCQRPARTGWKLTDEYNANMNIIAAAPKLLEHLQKCVEALEEVSYQAWCGQVIDEARAEIAKALGESQ